MKPTLFSCYVETLIQRLQKSRRFRTAETYGAASRSFIRFLGGKDIPIGKITGSLIAEYQAWLAGNEKKPNTISFYLRNLRAIYNNAVYERLISDTRPFMRTFTGNAETMKRAITLGELRSLCRCPLLKSRPSLRLARDMFVMSFLLRGMSLVDMAWLKKTNLVNGRLEYHRKKTGRLLSVKWTDEMNAIIKKYPDDSPFLLPILGPSPSIRAFRSAAQKINRNLDQLARLLNINSGHLTFYAARHTWASVARDNGVPISVISAGMGHSSERTTRIYLSSLDHRHVDDANSALSDLIFN